MMHLLTSYAVGFFIPLFELVDLLVKLVLRRRVSHIAENGRALPTSVQLGDAGEATPVQRVVRPYKVLVSVRNIAGEFEAFRRNLSLFGLENVCVVDDHSTDDTPRLLREAGVPHLRNEVNAQKPGSILRALGELSEEYRTVVVIDPDAEILNLNPREFQKTVSDFHEVLADFQQSGYDACAVRVVAQCNSFLEKLQNFEYKLTMSLTKKSMRHFVAVSGAFAIYDRTSLERTLRAHSKSVYGEDYESSLLLHAAAGRTYYDGRLVVRTSQRQSLKELTKQRMGWDLSLLKIHVQLLRKLRHMPRRPLYLYQYFLYNTVYLIVLHPFRVLSAVFVGLSFLNLMDNVLGLHVIREKFYNQPFLCVAFYVFACLYAYLVLLVCERRRRGRYAFLPLAYPLYSLYLALVPKTLGYLNYLSLVLLRRKIVEDGYNSALRQPLLG